MARKSRKNKAVASPVVKKYMTAIYARISSDKQGEDSIDSQIEYVKDYVLKDNAFELVDVYTDEGYTGTNFNRPEFKRMMEDLRNGKINCIVVKDLSRFAREHIGAGDYLNNIFPFLGVRFIAIMDGYDNINVKPEEYFLASFISLAHAHYAAETSHKTANSIRARQKQGKYIGRSCAYGYAHDPNDYHRLIIVEEQATVIREIFERVAAGEKPNDVRIDLNSRKVLDPPWSPERMRNTLKNEYYKGTLVLRRSMTSLYKGEKKHSIPKEQQLRFENSDRVPVIVSPKIWQKAQDTIAARRAAREDAPECKYKGLVFCASCGGYIRPGYVHRDNAYHFCCRKCRIANTIDRVLDIAVKEHLGLSDDTKISADLLNKHFQKIFLCGKKHFSFQISDSQ